MSDLRWYVKKAARGGVALGAWGSGVVRAERMVSPGPRVRALTYHRFGHEPKEAFCVAPEEFEVQMAWLASEGLAVSQEDVIEFVRGRRALPDGAVLVTIDDGCISTLEIALPIMQKHRIPGVAFISTELVGAGYLGLPERYMTWDEIRSCAKAGMTIGSHSHAHKSLGQMSIDDARAQIRRSKETLERELDQSVKSFAYPFGTHGDFSDATDRALRDAGFEIAFNSQHGAIRPAPGREDALVSLPRVKVEGGEALWMFRLLALGAMDPWRVVDRNLWRLQRVRKEISTEAA
ncbi:polysaccharide deacetylase family protein [Sandaracinus amylolyticus]|uniref:Polysaccharide deacetylase n=1 Tax=Sandaracinus amylolyticus TaxID=927083 RepID=A0A0F6YIV6_9BACT|nr:polysaccharide deacetylase family protein [Sandaracinus amylolyticus]AKF07178.1 Polysaccharide deacetylase [Sandaracinus amylolyticus]